MRIEPETGGVSIVLLGNFNPAIFTPAWFARWGLISEKEAEEAKVDVIHPEIVAFTVGTKHVRVQNERFTVESSEAPWITLCDLVVKTFQEFLPHTPASKLGINRSVHFSVGSEEVRNAMGRKLAPTTAWGEWGPILDKGPSEARSGFMSLTMQEMWKAPDLEGYYQALIEPSKKLGGNSGIFMRVNTHTQVVDPKAETGCEQIIRHLGENFQASITRSEWIIDQIMKLKEGIGQ